MTFAESVVYKSYAHPGRLWGMTVIPLGRRSRGAASRTEDSVSTVGPTGIRVRLRE